MKVFVTRSIPGTALDKLKNSGHEVNISDYDRSATAQELLEKGKGADALLTLLTDKIDGEVMDAGLPQLKIIAAKRFYICRFPLAAQLLEKTLHHRNCTYVCSYSFTC